MTEKDKPLAVGNLTQIRRKIAIVVGMMVLWFFGFALLSSAVIELEKAIIQVNGSL